MLESVAMMPSIVYAEPTLEDMRAQLAAAEEQADKLRREIAELRKAEKADAIESIKAQIADYSIEPDDLFEKKQSRKAKPEAEKSPRAVYRDSVTGGCYRGGKFPNWLAARIAETGLEYDDYRLQFMTRVN